MAKKNVSLIALDTNIIVRYLVGDVLDQFEVVKDLFRKAENGSVRLLVLPTVIAEVSYVLQRFYGKSVIEISSHLQSFLSESWYEIEHKEALLGMWGWYEQGNHFVDSYLIALNKFENIELFSFDKKLNKMVEKKG